MTIQKTDPLKFLCIDLFCGAGGTTSGLEKARDKNGRKLAKVVACINHDPIAIKSHAANHERALHVTEDIRRADIRPIIDRVNEEKTLHPDAQILLWASAECTNYSGAKGGLPKNADSRTLPNAIIRYIKALKLAGLMPDYVHVENVREFMSWGPLDESGRPISRYKGRDYIRWCNRIQRIGYDYDWRLLNSANYGAYTARLRYFGMFAKHGLPIKFPEATHARKSTGGVFGQLLPWKPVKEVLELDKEGRSIFDRKTPLAERTLARIYSGLKKHVAGGENKWLINYKGKESKGNSVDYPAPTLTTRDGFALAKADFIQSYYGNGGTSSTEQPSPTITTRDRLSLVSAQWLDKRYNAAHNHQSIDFPAGTLTTVPKFALMTAEQFIMPTNYDAEPHGLDRPLGVITANRKWHYIISPVAFIGESREIYIRIDDNDSPMMRKIKEFMVEYRIVDVKMRMLFVVELMRITGFDQSYHLVGSQEDKKRFIGNAVPPILPQRMIEALNEVLEYQVTHLAV